MEVFETLAIKIPNAVLIDGVTEHSVDEVINFLEQYGDIGRKVAIFSGSKTNTYLADLKRIAKLSRRDYAEVLSEGMTQIRRSLAELNPETPVVAKPEPEDSKPPDSVFPPSLPASLPSKSLSAASGAEAQGGERHSASIPAADLNPPEVQRYVVEHVVRSGDSLLHAFHQLRAFSGKVPRPIQETDYDTWRSGVELALKDPSISDLQRTRLIRDSLLPPACNIVKHLSLDTPPEIYMKQLDSAYGTVQDGEELFAKFMDTFQDSGEKPSAYLPRLQVALQHAAKRGGVLEKDMDKQLLNQFCRGCWDNNLISELQLKQKKHNPPKFAELLLLLRTEEDREAAKTLRMKQHLGMTKQKATTNAQFVNTVEETNLCTALTTALTTDGSYKTAACSFDSTTV
uniref:Paraneoplastic antigen Ma-like C-terminal domain-containing protein n=1 Tax=Oreochromis niloticus TaxID=8128 RepID=A0A669CP67_ORENI